MKNIIILERNTESARTNFNYVLWAAVPAGREAIWAGQTSAYDGATQAEQDALASGQVAQATGSYQKEEGTNLATAQADLEAAWAQFNTYVQNHNPKNRYGTYWEQGIGWTAGGIS